MKNLSQIIKRELLKEQNLDAKGDTDPILAKLKNPELRLAYTTGCFPIGYQPYTLTLSGESPTEVFIGKSSRADLKDYDVYALPQKSGESTGRLLYMKPGANNQPNESTKIERTWSCEDLKKATADSFSPDIEEFVTEITNANPKIQIYKYNSPSVKKENKYNGVCQLVLLKPIVDKYGTAVTKSKVKENMYVWQCGQSSETAELKAEIGAYAEMGYQLCTPAQISKMKAGSTDVISINLKGMEYCTETLPDSVKNQMNTLTAATETVFNQQGNPNSREYKEACRNVLSLYGDFAENNWPINVYVLKTKVQPRVLRCMNQSDKIGGFLAGDKWNKIKNIIQSTPVRPNDYGQSVDWRINSQSKTETKPEVKYSDVNESRDRILKKIIRENLNELSESKKKSLVEEYNIINKRFNFIVENGKPKTKKQKTKFADDVINEIFYLKSQGFNETLINEQFMDIIKSFFGGVPGGIFDTIKERFVQYILEKLEIGTDGYLVNIFIATIGDIPIGDYLNGKIFTCEYLSNSISKGIGEGIARKIQKEKGMEGYFYDIIRNSLVEMFTDSSFGDKVEKAIGQAICPSLPKIQDKFESAAENMKEKALA